MDVPLSLLLDLAPNVRCLKLDMLAPVEYDAPADSAGLELFSTASASRLRSLALTHLHVGQPRAWQSNAIECLIAQSPSLAELRLPGSCTGFDSLSGRLTTVLLARQLEKVHWSEHAFGVLAAAGALEHVREVTLDHSSGCAEPEYSVAAILPNLLNLETLVVQVKNSCYHLAQSAGGEPCCLLDRMREHFLSRYTSLPPRLTAICLYGEQTATLPPCHPLPTRPLPTQAPELPLTADNVDGQVPVGVLISGRGVTAEQELVHVQVRRRQQDAFRLWAPAEWEDETEDLDLYWLVERSGSRQAVDYGTATSLVGPMTLPMLGRDIR